MTVSELKERLLGAAIAAGGVAGPAADDVPDPRFMEAVRALPDTTLLGGLAPEMRAVIEEGLRVCSDAPPPRPPVPARKTQRSRRTAK